MFPFKNKTLIYEQKAVGQEQLFITESVDDATMATQAVTPDVNSGHETLSHAATCLA
jgi:hypothetical protein